MQGVCHREGPAFCDYNILKTNRMRFFQLMVAIEPKKHKWD